MLALGNAPLDWPTWLASVNLFQLATVIVALYVTIRLLVKFWPWLGKLMKFTDAQTKLPEFIDRTDKALAAQKVTLEEQNKKIAEIHHETHNNDGSSMKDTADRLEMGLKALYDRVVATERAAAEAADRIKQIENITPSKEHRNGNENDDQH